MTRAQFIALIASVSGASFVAGRVIDYTGGKRPTATFFHALRIEETQTIGYQTKVRTQSDGGLDFEDLGPSLCVGNIESIKTWVLSRVPDAGRPRVIELRGELSGTAVEVYGDSVVRALLKGRLPSPLTKEFGSLSCVPVRSPTRTVPL